MLRIKLTESTDARNARVNRMNLNSNTVLFSDLAIGDSFTLSFSISKVVYVKHSQTRALIESIPDTSPMQNYMIGSSQVFTCGELVQRVTE